MAQQVMIKTIAGKALTIEFPYSGTVGELKNRIFEEVAFCDENKFIDKDLRLIFAGGVLKNDSVTLESLNFNNKSCMIVTGTAKKTTVTATAAPVAVAAPAPAPVPAAAPAPIAPLAAVQPAWEDNPHAVAAVPHNHNHGHDHGHQQVVPHALLAQLLPMIQAAMQGGEMPEGFDPAQLMNLLQNPEAVQQMMLDTTITQFVTPGHPLHEKLRTDLMQMKILQVLNDVHPEMFTQMLTSKEYIQALINSGVLGIGNSGGNMEDEFEEFGGEPEDASEQNKNDVNTLVAMGFDRAIVIQIYYGPADRNMDGAASMLYEMQNE